MAHIPISPESTRALARAPPRCILELDAAIIPTWYDFLELTEATATCGVIRAPETEMSSNELGSSQSIIIDLTDAESEGSECNN
ncbi:hypothetical protein N7467_006079 [Penicillium canescens]|nr:hypothetical protein N7467_006079 [Penicillium canescens]